MWLNFLGKKATKAHLASWSTLDSEEKIIEVSAAFLEKGPNVIRIRLRGALKKGRTVPKVTKVRLRSPVEKNSQFSASGRRYLGVPWVG